MLAGGVPPRHGLRGLPQGTGHPGHHRTRQSVRPTTVPPSVQPPSHRPTYLIVWNYLPEYTKLYGMTRVTTVYDGPAVGGTRGCYAGVWSRIINNVRNVRKYHGQQDCTTGALSVSTGAIKRGLCPNSTELAGMYQSVPVPNSVRQVYSWSVSVRLGGNNPRFYAVRCRTVITSENPTVYGGTAVGVRRDQSVGVRQVQGRITHGFGLDGQNSQELHRGVTEVQVYGRCTAGGYICRCRVRLVSNTPGLRRPGSGGHCSARCCSRKRITTPYASQWPLHHGLRRSRGHRDLCSCASCLWSLVPVWYRPAFGLPLPYR